MEFKKIFNSINIFKSKNKAQETKSYDYSPFFSDFLNIGNYNINQILSLVYYATVSAISTPIDLICDEFQTLKPVIWDKKEKKYVDDTKFNDLLNLLNHPNSDQTKTELYSYYSRFYNITGNAFLVAGYGNINKPPLEITNINPAYISINGNTKDKYVDSYVYQSSSQRVVFNRKENINGFRYINKDEDLEIWQVKDFTPKTCEDSLWGLSRLNSIYLEISQFIQSNKHNLSVLLKGIRSSGAITSETGLTQDQRDGIKSQISSDNAGASNAGGLFLFDGGKFDFKEFSKSMKDMDFKELKILNKNDIRARYKVPKELLGESSTYENQYQAKLGLYDNVIIPLDNKLSGELSLFLMPRFNIDPNRYSITFNIFDVEVLKEREIRNVERLKKTNILTTNELRKKLNLENTPGGDVIYQPFSFVPLGTEKNVQSELKKLEILKKELTKIKYANGDNLYLIDR